MKGWKFLLFVFFPLMALVAGLFLVLTPSLTRKKPGHLYVGVRFEDEASVAFIDRNGAQPLTHLDLAPAQASPAGSGARAFPGLRRGKNRLDLSGLPEGLYRLDFSSPGYLPISLLLEKSAGEFQPTPAASAPREVLLLPQFIGLRFQPAPPPGPP